MAALTIRDDLTADDLRRWARKARTGRAVARAYAIAGALDGMSRAAAARAAGMERQALRDAVVRYNAEGVAGLSDRGPDPERDGVSAWTRADLCRWLEAEFSKTYHPASMGRVLRGLNMSRQKIRPAHPEKDPEAEESFKKGGSATA